MMILTGKADANMGVRRSVTGKCAKYGGAMVMGRTRCRVVAAHSMVRS